VPVPVKRSAYLSVIDSAIDSIMGGVPSILGAHSRVGTVVVDRSERFEFRSGCLPASGRPQARSYNIHMRTGCIASGQAGGEHSGQRSGQRRPLWLRTRFAEAYAEPI